MKRILCLLLCLLTLLPLISCGRTSNAPSVPTDTDTQTVIETETDAETDAETDFTPRGVAEIADRVIYLFEGDTYRLQTSVEGERNAVQWTSSTDCVSVADGVVTALREGYAWVSGGGETRCSVRVLAKSMPTVSINTGGSAITSKETYVPCLVSVNSTNSSFCFEKASAGIRLRGNSSSGFAKKPYRIQFSSKQGLLGMNEGAECRSWVLLAERTDDSMIHNSTALGLASMILTEYTSDWRYVGLYLNGVYQGVYLLAEQSQIHPARVDIEEAGVDSTDLRSGYLFEMDRRSQNPAFKIDTPEYEFTNFLGEKHNCKTLVFNLKNNDLSEEQKAFASKYYQNAFLILYYATYYGTAYTLDENADLVLHPSMTPREAIERAIDVDSLALKYIHSELVCNSDDHQLSYYTHVDLSESGTGLLTFSCPWDFDYAFSDSMTHLYHDPESYFAARRTVWYVMILHHDWFRDLVSEHWNQLYEETHGFAAVRDMMRSLTEVYQREFYYDKRLWARTGNQPDEAAIMYEWVNTRILWLNERFGEGDWFLTE